MSPAKNVHVGKCVLVWEVGKAYLVVFRHRLPVIDQDRFQDLWNRKLHVGFLVVLILEERRAKRGGASDIAPRKRTKGTHFLPSALRPTGAILPCARPRTNVLLAHARDGLVLRLGRRRPAMHAGGVGLLEVLLQRQVALRDLEEAVRGDPLIPPVNGSCQCVRAHPGAPGKRGLAALGLA